MCCIKKILSKNKLSAAAYIAIGIFNSFLANYKADYFQKVVDGLTDGSIALRGIIFYGAVLMVSYCMNYAEEYPGKKLEYGIFLDFKLSALKKISRIDYLEYQKLGTGKLVQRIESGAEAGRNLIYCFWFCLVRQLLPTIIFSVYFIWKIDKTITYGILCGYVIVFIVTNLLLKGLYQIKEKILTNEERLNHYLVRGFMEMTVFRMRHQFPQEIKKACEAREDIVHSKVKMNMIHEAFFTIFALLVALLNLGILVYAWYSREISVGSVAALLSLLDNAYTPIAIFNVLYVQYKLDKASFHRFDNFLGLTEDNQLEKGKEVPMLQGDFKIRNLSFQYKEEKCSQEHRIFDKLCLDIQKGEKVALVGESGSGKSTLVKLLTGLLKYNAGSIRVDGLELKELCLSSLYDHMSYISQESPVFDGTLRENLVFDQKADDSVLKEALDRVGLLPLFRTMNKGLETEIGEKGTILSGGERQKLALARLWFEQKEIIILDEATSAMDNLTEESVMKEILRRFQDRTVIAVAHRLASIVNFDKIVVFYQGQIVGQGTFEELIRDNTYFAQLYHTGKIC